ELTFPPAANPQGLSALVDVLLTFDLNAFWRPDAAASTSDAARSGLGMLLSAGTFDSKGAFALHTGIGGASGASVTLDFDISGARPPEGPPLAIANLGVVAVGLPATQTPVRVTVATAIKSASADLAGNVALSNSGKLAGTQPPSALNALVGELAN